MVEKKSSGAEFGKKSGNAAPAGNSREASGERESSPDNVRTGVSGTVTTTTSEALKAQFAAGSIPLQTDFGNLIDIAECGRRAIGQSADQTNNSIGGGLSLAPDSDADNKGKLSVKAYNGIAVDANGVGVKVLLNGSSPSDGLVASTDGLKIRRGACITVDNNGIAVKCGNGIDASSDYVCVKAGHGITVDSTGVSINPATVLPKGMIVMFSGTAIPTGWALCDGTNGTPNLTSRFILGAPLGGIGKYSSSTVGSDNTYSATSDTKTPPITTTISGTQLSTDQIPSHSHTVQTNDGSHRLNSSIRGDKSGGSDYSSPIIVNGSETNNIYIAAPVGGGKAHGHAATSTQSAHNHTVSITTPYYTLAFIMKT